MFNLLKVIDLDPGLPATEEEHLLKVLAESGESLPGVKAARASKTLPRALNGGRLMWRLVFNSEHDYKACLLSKQWRTKIAPVLAPARGVSVDSVAYQPAFWRTSLRRRGGIWRCLVLSVEANARAEDVRQLEKDLLLMPEHVSTIRNWALGHVVSALGRRRWTHVWEQEFDDVQGLEGEYMMHPIHWGLVDGWFDPECPQRIVDPFLIHAAFAIEETVII